ncbi:IS66 family transposase [Methylobacterium sp. DCY52]|uniref:IS66 family transposase n=1 Tax=Methylobacterium sp. DCY52 TaxID=739139 RepID=UPI003144EF9D
MIQVPRGSRVWLATGHTDMRKGFDGLVALVQDHLARDPYPCTCLACGGGLRRIGEDVTQSLDYVPGHFKVVRHVREAVACRACEQVVQASAPRHAVPRGRAGPGLLAHIAVAKFDDYLPLYRQTKIYARDGVDLATSTLLGWLGGTAATLRSLVDSLRREVIAGSAVLHGDDTPIPVLAPGSGKTRTGRLWTYVRDGRPNGGTRPPAAVFFASPDRWGERPLAHVASFSGVPVADGYVGFNGLQRKPAQVVRSPKQSAGRMCAARSSTCTP